ncbi:PQQ-binding-like beta-propeller repeat protein [Nonomuraea angiospora]|uniref:nSTAND1 domain-containing NTPase n=1 Tax=Nonomuraea angiospora TaxID=46172 RepID=UPI003413CDBA
MEQGRDGPAEEEPGHRSAHEARARVASVVRRAGSDLLKLSPQAVIATLCASALVPLAFAGAGGLVAAGIQVAAGVGGNVLADVISRSMDAVRRRTSGRPLSQEEVEGELGAQLLAALQGVDGGAPELRRAIAGVLHEIDAPGAALEAAIGSGDPHLQSHLTAVFSELGERFAEFGQLLDDLSGKAVQLQEMLHRQAAEQRQDRDLALQQSVQLILIREEIAAFNRRTAGAQPDGATGPRWRDEAPYRGLWPFERNHSPIFYGRERATAKLLGKLAERLSGSGLAMVTGASGAGKSSLLRAGLLPALARGLLPGAPDSEHWPQVVMTPTSRPLDELAVRLSALGRLEPLAVRRSVAANPQDVHLMVRHAVLADAERHERREQGRLVLVVDQFEEVFLLAQREEREAFLDALVAAARAPALVVLAVRGDFAAECAGHPVLADALEDGQFVLGPMSESDLRRTITGPAATAEVDLEPGLVDSVLADLRSHADEGGYGAGVLPLLSQAMLLTWDKRDGRTLTNRAYGLIGGVAHAVESAAEEVYESLPADRQRLTRDVFLQLAGIGPEGQLVSRRARRAELLDSFPAERAADVEAVLEAFTTRRLLVAGGGDGEADDGTVEIAHDALLRSWPKLSGWLDEGRSDYLVFRQFMNTATDWQAGGRDPAYLYRGTRLAALREAYPRWAGDSARRVALADTHRAFLDASERASARGARRRRATVAALVVLLLASLAGAGIAVDRATQATAQENAARSRELAGRSLDLSESDPALSRLLAVAAHQVDDTPESRHSLLTALLNPARAVFTGDREGVWDMAFGPDGRTLATAGQEGAVRLWDAVTGRPIGAPMTTPGASVYAVAFSRDGGSLLSASGSAMNDDRGAVRVWDVKSQRSLGALLEYPRSIDMMELSRDGRTVAAVSTDNTLYAWDLTTRRQIAKFTDDSVDSAADLAISPDGRTVVTAGKRIRVWDLVRHREIKPGPARVSDNQMTKVAFTPDGTRLLSAEDGGTVRWWDTATYHQIGKPLTNAGETLAISPDGTMLATDGAGYGITLYDLATRKPAGTPFVGHTRPVQDVTFSPDGATLASTDTGGTVRLWDLTRGRQAGQPITTGDTRPITSMALSPDGSTIAAARQKDVLLWNLATRKRTGRPLAARTVLSGRLMAFSPDGKVLATGEYSGRIRLWDVTTGEQIGPALPGHPPTNETGGRAWLREVAFSPDGTTLASTGSDGTLRLWNTRSHQQIGQSPQVGDVAPLAFSPDGTILAAGTPGGVIRLWDPATGWEKGVPLRGHTDNIDALVFNPQGTMLASMGWDGTIRFWDLRTRSQLGQPMVVQTDEDLLAFSPDGRLLVSTGASRAIRLWDVATRRQIGRPLTGHDKAISGVAFTPDGRTLVSAGSDATIRFWNLALPDDLEARVCDLAQRPITPQEWTFHLPGKPYEAVCPPAA